MFRESYPESGYQVPMDKVPAHSVEIRGIPQGKLAWHPAHRRCQQLVALRILVPGPGLGVPHIRTLPAKVTQIIQAALKVEGKQLAPSCPSQASRELHFLP